MAKVQPCTWTRGFWKAKTSSNCRPFQTAVVIIWFQFLTIPIWNPQRIWEWLKEELDRFIIAPKKKTVAVFSISSAMVSRTSCHKLCLNCKLQVASPGQTHLVYSNSVLAALDPKTLIKWQLIWHKQQLAVILGLKILWELFKFHRYHRITIGSILEAIMHRQKMMTAVHSLKISTGNMQMI